MPFRVFGQEPLDRLDSALFGHANVYQGDISRIVFEKCDDSFICASFMPPAQTARFVREQSGDAFVYVLAAVRHTHMDSSVAYQM